MATKAPAKAAAPAAPAKSSKGIERKRRNSLERKCLPKYLKTQFSGSSHSLFRGLLTAWKDSRKKQSGGPRD